MTSGVLSAKRPANGTVEPLHEHGQVNARDLPVADDGPAVDEDAVRTADVAEEQHAEGVLLDGAGEGDIVSAVQGDVRGEARVNVAEFIAVQDGCPGMDEGRDRQPGQATERDTGGDGLTVAGP